MLKSTLYLLLAAAAVALVATGGGEAFQGQVVALPPQALVEAGTAPRAVLPPPALSETSVVHLPAAPHYNASFRLTLDFGDGAARTVAAVPFAPGQTLLEVMKAKFKREQVAFEYKAYGDLGEFVTAIGGRKNTGRNYWQFWVNGTYATVSAGRYRPKNGDIVEWKFTDSKVSFRGRGKIMVKVEAQMYYFSHGQGSYQAGRQARGV